MKNKRLFTLNITDCGNACCGYATVSLHVQYESVSHKRKKKTFIYYVYENDDDETFFLWKICIGE